MSSEDSCHECNNTEGEHKPSCTYYSPLGRWCDLTAEQQALHMERRLNERVQTDREAFGDDIREGTVFTSETQYKLKLSVENFKLVTRYDDEVNLQGITEEGTLIDRLEEEAWARSIEYNGHFGPYIYFSFQEQHDGTTARMIAKRIIMDFLEEAKVYYKGK